MTSTAGKWPGDRYWPAGRVSLADDAQLIAGWLAAPERAAQIQAWGKQQGRAYLYGVFDLVLQGMAQSARAVLDGTGRVFTRDTEVVIEHDPGQAPVSARA